MGDGICTRVRLRAYYPFGTHASDTRQTITSFESSRLPTFSFRSHRESIKEPSCVADCLWRALLEAFVSFVVLALEPKSEELSRSAQRQQLSLPSSVEMFSALQSMRLRILQVSHSRISYSGNSANKLRPYRCTIRGSRRTILSFVCFVICITEVVY